MSEIERIFENIKILTHTDGPNEFISLIKKIQNEDSSNEKANVKAYTILKSFIQKIFDVIDELGLLITKDGSILISLKNQKLLRTCFQLISCLCISPCLIPGLGIPLSKRCSSCIALPTLTFSDEQKYEMLVNSSNFFVRCYMVPVLKSIIITFHLSDYLASLIQLSFAPLKKPGTYKDFVMTQQRYNELTRDRQHFIDIYKNLVTNCFQPMLMKELLVLQSITEPAPPTFVKRVISKEMSQRLLCPGGLLSLIRCFIESHYIDTGYDWKKIDMICKIIVAKHGVVSDNDYLCNICMQLAQILTLNNSQYLSTAVSCLLSLHEKYSDSDPVKNLVQEAIQPLYTDTLKSTANISGTIVLSPQQLSQKINILHACLSTKMQWPIKLLQPNLYILFLVGIKCTKNQDLILKLIDTIVKCLERIDKEELFVILKSLLFGNETIDSLSICVEEYEAGVAIKCMKSNEDHKKEEKLAYFINIFNGTSDNTFVKNVFEISLQILTDLSIKRKQNTNKDMLLIEDDPLLLNKVDEQYMIILQLLSEISASPKVVNVLKTQPMIILQFMEHFILKEYEANEECATVALVLLNTILSNSNSLLDLKKSLSNFIPKLTKIASDTSSFNHILSKEILSLITSGESKKESKCEKALGDVFDTLLPVRAHGLMELTKLMESGDPETISKKHYIFFLFQEQLKDSDSYIYLSAINGLAALATHCTEDVLQVLCNEFLQSSNGLHLTVTKDNENKLSEQRMKIGDVIVKVTKKLGEMAIVHKANLLNTMLCGCRDEDPLIRTSALSNLAEIVLVLHYKLGSIIYEVLLCVWSIVETDKAVECRRAAVMVISSLFKGLGKETLIQLKDNLLPIYRTLKELYRDTNEDSIVRLHAQIALEELNDVVNQFLFPEIKMEKQIFVLDKPENVFK